MSGMRQLYQEVILDHGKRPRNHNIMEDADHEAQGSNPLCGDHISVYLKTAGGRISEISFQGSGCLIAIASASMMTEAVQGKTAAASASMVDIVADLAAGAIEPDSASALPEELKALAGVKEFPVRIKCATLPWRTLRAALRGRSGTVTTE
jgi:nitrogen fixation NifU-like protein